MPTEVRQGDDHEHDWVDIYLHNCLATGNHEPCFICEECGLGQCEDCGSVLEEVPEGVGRR